MARLDRPTSLRAPGWDLLRITKVWVVGEHQSTRPGKHTHSELERSTIFYGKIRKIHYLNGAIFHSYVSLPGVMEYSEGYEYSIIFTNIPQEWLIYRGNATRYVNTNPPSLFCVENRQFLKPQNQMFAANVVFRVNSWHPWNTFKHNVYPTNIVTLTRYMIFLDALLQWWILGVENNLSKTALNVNLWTKPITIQSKLMGYVMNPIHNYFILSRKMTHSLRILQWNPKLAVYTCKLALQVASFVFRDYSQRSRQNRYLLNSPMANK